MKMSLPFPWLPCGCHDTWLPGGHAATGHSRSVSRCVQRLLAAACLSEEATLLDQSADKSDPLIRWAKMREICIDLFFNFHDNKEANLL